MKERTRETSQTMQLGSPVKKTKQKEEKYKNTIKMSDVRIKIIKYKYTITCKFSGVAK